MDRGNLAYLEIEYRTLNYLGGKNAGRINSETIPTDVMNNKEENFSRIHY